MIPVTAKIERETEKINYQLVLLSNLEQKTKEIQTKTKILRIEEALELALAIVTWRERRKEGKNLLLTTRPLGQTACLASSQQ